MASLNISPENVFCVVIVFTEGRIYESSTGFLPLGPTDILGGIILGGRGLTRAPQDVQQPPLQPPPTNCQEQPLSNYDKPKHLQTLSNHPSLRTADLV